MRRVKRGLLAGLETEVRGPASIRWARMAGGFLWFLVRCRCGRRFAHRADRRLIVCYVCGRAARLLMVRRRARRGRATWHPSPRPDTFVRVPAVYAIARGVRPS